MRISLVLVSFGFVCIVNAAPFVEDVEPEGGRPEDVNTLSAYNRNTNVVRYSSGEGRSYGEGEGKKVYYGEGEESLRYSADYDGMRRSYGEGEDESFGSRRSYGEGEGNGISYGQGEESRRSYGEDEGAKVYLSLNAYPDVDDYDDYSSDRSYGKGEIKTASNRRERDDYGIRQLVDKLVSEAISESLNPAVSGEYSQRVFDVSGTNNKIIF